MSIFTPPPPLSPQIVSYRTRNFWLMLLAGILFVSFNLSSAKAATEISTVAKYAMVTDFESGRVLLEKQKDAPMKPASMAKIMTIYLAFSRIADGSLLIDDMFIVSEKAWKMGGSRSFLNLSESYNVEELLHGVIVQSGNDAAVVMAEGISGSEENFTAEMNVMAKKLGMNNTVFTNSTGWPHPDVSTTAEDLNILTTSLIRDFPIETYPSLYPIFSKKNYTINDIKQGNRNPLLYGKNASANGADGLKTGYTNESGYGLVASAERSGQRVVMVLNGMLSKKERSVESSRLMNLIFREFKLYTFYNASAIVDEAEVWLGAESHLPLLSKTDLMRVLSRTERANTTVSVTWVSPVPAPIAKGQKIGKMTLSIDGAEVDSVDLVAAVSVEQLSLLDRLGAAMKYLIFGASAGKDTGKDADAISSVQ